MPGFEDHNIVGISTMQVEAMSVVQESSRVKHRALSNATRHMCAAQQQVIISSHALTSPLPHLHKRAACSSALARGGT
jgi:hypothetical protein